GPFVLHVQGARCDQDCELIQFGWHRRVESNVGSQLLRQVAHLRAAEQDVEGTVYGPSLARQQVLHQNLLFRRKFAGSEWFEAVASQMKISRDGGLRGGNCSESQNDNQEKSKSH